MGLHRYIGLWNMLSRETVLLYSAALVCLGESKMMDEQRLKNLLKDTGCSEKVVSELWKWYDSSEKKGVASF
jgi:hypothetical protein